MNVRLPDSVNLDLGRHLRAQDAAERREEALAAMAAETYPAGCCEEFIERAIPGMPLNLAKRLVAAVRLGAGMAAIGDVIDDYLRWFAEQEAEIEITDRENSMEHDA